MGHPLKKMIRDLGIPAQRLNVSIFDAPVLPNRVLRAARTFRTPTEHEASCCPSLRCCLRPCSMSPAAMNSCTPSETLNRTSNRHEMCCLVVCATKSHAAVGVHGQCWEACVAEEACGMWIWCSGKAGCDSNGDFNGRFPHKCVLLQVPVHASLTFMTIMTCGCSGMWPLWAGAPDVPGGGLRGPHAQGV